MASLNAVLVEERKIGRYRSGRVCLQAFYPTAGGPLWFGLPVTAVTNSLVTLNVIADSLQLVTNESPGKIIYAQVKLCKIS